MVDDDKRKEFSNKQDDSLGLDDFLRDNDEDLNDPFPLDDETEADDENPYTYDEPQKSKGGGFAKFLGYTALIALIAGGGYVAYQYVPAFQNNISFNQADRFDTNDANIADNGYQSSPMTNSEFMGRDSEMPTPSDMNAPSDIDNDISNDVSANPELLAIYDNQNGESSEIGINEALELAENEAAIEEVENDVDAEIANAFDQDFPDESMPSDAVENVSEENLADGDFSQVPTAPAINAFESFDNEMATADTSDSDIEIDTVESTESETILVTETPEEPILEVEEQGETSDNEIIADVADDLDADDDVMADEPEVADIVEPKPAPSAPRTTQTVATPAPARTAYVAPQPEKYSINTAAQLSAAQNARVVQGQEALARGDFAQADQIFTSILASDPSNVHALTGKQMAASRIRGGATTTFVGNDTALMSETQSANVSQVQGMPTSVTAATATESSTPSTAQSAPMATSSHSVAVTTDGQQGQKPSFGTRPMYAGDLTRPGQASSSVGRSAPTAQAGMPAPQMAQPSGEADAQINWNTNTQAQPTPPVNPQSVETSELMKRPVQPQSVTSLPSRDMKIKAPSESIQAMLLQMKTNPQDARSALELANAYDRAGQKMEALEWYRKALKLDALYNTGIDRLAVYDAMALIQ